MSMSLGARGDAVLEDVRAFVDQREHQALHDLLVGDLARRDAQLLAVVLDHLVDQLGRDRVALAGLVVVPAGAGLLAEAAQLAQLVGACGCTSCRRAPCARRLRIAQPMSLPARSPMRNGPIAKPNFSIALSTCCGVAPSSSRKPAWRLYCSIMRLPMKPSHTPETTAVFLIFLAERHHGGQHVLGGLARRAPLPAASSRWPG